MKQTTSEVKIFVFPSTLLLHFLVYLHLLKEQFTKNYIFLGDSVAVKKHKLALYSSPGVIQVSESPETRVDFQNAIFTTYFETKFHCSS